MSPRKRGEEQATDRQLPPAHPVTPIQMTTTTPTVAKPETIEEDATSTITRQKESEKEKEAEEGKEGEKNLKKRREDQMRTVYCQSAANPPTHQVLPGRHVTSLAAAAAAAAAAAVAAAATAAEIAVAVARAAAAATVPVVAGVLVAVVP